MTSDRTSTYATARVRFKGTPYRPNSLPVAHATSRE
jgi:hypothetical protein